MCLTMSGNPSDGRVGPSSFDCGHQESLKWDNSDMQGAHAACASQGLTADPFPQMAFQKEPSYIKDRGLVGECHSGPESLSRRRCPAPAHPSSPASPRPVKPGRIAPPSSGSYSTALIRPLSADSLAPSSGCSRDMEPTACVHACVRIGSKMCLKELAHTITRAGQAAGPAGWNLRPKVMQRA